MAEAAEGPNRGRIIALVIATVVVLAGVIIGVTYLTGGGATPSATESPTARPTDTTTPGDSDGGEDGDDVKPVPTPSSQVLTETLGGQEAIDALGDKIEIVANRNNKTVEQVEELLLRDKSAKVSTNGYIVYIDSKVG